MFARDDGMWKITTLVVSQSISKHATKIGN